MRLIRFLIGALLTLVVFQVLNQRQGSIPPLGKFMDPFGGFWRNNEKLDELPDTLDVLGLRQPVTVIWDDRQVPHIFAKSSHDLYFAQGYLTARHRLWQMEFVTHVAAGRVSEIIGDRALEFDRTQRRRGMVLAAEQALDFVREDAETHAIIQSYADGVNAWIDQLAPARYPIEYKLLDYEPEPWSTLKTTLLLKYMAWDLTGRNSELDLTRILEQRGADFVSRYYPEISPFTDPIVPRGKRWRFDPIPHPVPEGSDPLHPDAFPGLWEPQPHTGNGSNNWAVAGKKTKSGYPILANDPHLGLALPSIWYEVQLCDDTQNVYGVSLPGAPAVIIGFNDAAAWGVTNAGSDVMDWYEVEFKDEKHQAVRYEGIWEPVELRPEEILIRGGRTVVDTLRLTRFGPVVRYGKVEDSTGVHDLGLAMRWAAHDPSNELATFIGLNHAKSYEEYRAALEQYDCPAQNFVFASRSGDIAIQHNGKFPVRFEDQGKFVQDGRDSTGVWRSFIPRDQLPSFLNPYRGFVSSANQHPTGRGYPYFLGWDYETWERGARINERLGQMTDIVPEDMVRLQMDDLNVFARQVLPVLLNRLPDSWSDSLADSVTAMLGTWDRHNRADSPVPWFFHDWWKNLQGEIWEDELRYEDQTLKFPSRAVTAEILRKRRPDPVIDDRGTDSVETLSGLIQHSFLTTLDSFLVWYGAPGESWELGKTRGTDLKHLLGLKGFGPGKLATSGGRKIVNATDVDHGPSWRMVVALGPEVKAVGVYPGGQSGNPGSPYYDQMVNAWVEGEVYPLIFLPTPDEFPTNHLGGATLMRNTQ